MSKRILCEFVDFSVIADRIFHILKGHGHKVTMYTDDGKPAIDPETEARRFYINDLQSLLTIDENGNKSEIRLYLSKDVVVDDIENLLYQLRKTAGFAGVSFNVDRYNRQLRPQDMKFMTYKAGISEAKDVTGMFGTKKTSRQKFGNKTKVLIKHNKSVNDDIRGGRSRNIAKIYLEDDLGQRILFPVNNLTAARAMARHLTSGGDVHDDFGVFIKNNAQEYCDLMDFKKDVRKQGLTLPNNAHIMSMIEERIREIRKCLSRTQGPQGYQQEVNNYYPDPVQEMVDFDATEYFPGIEGHENALRHIRKIMARHKDHSVPQEALKKIKQHFDMHPSISRHEILDKIDNGGIITHSDLKRLLNHLKSKTGLLEQQAVMSVIERLEKATDEEIDIDDKEIRKKIIKNPEFRKKFKEDPEEAINKKSGE